MDQKSAADGKNERSRLTLTQLMAGDKPRVTVRVNARLVVKRTASKSVLALAGWAAEDEANAALLVRDPLKACDQAGVDPSAAERRRGERLLRELNRRELPGNVDLNQLRVEVVKDASHDSLEKS
jgi:hypothetical protein